MSKEIKLPAFSFLGYNIQNINLKRIENEKLEEIRINIASAKYDEKSKVYSLVLTLSVDFTNSKGSVIEILGGFKINDAECLSNNDAINSIFSATIYPYLRTVFQNITSDDRPSIMLPTIDLRCINLKSGLSLKPDLPKEDA